MRRQDPGANAAGKYGAPLSNKADSLARKRETAQEEVRSREKNVGVPPKVRSKRDRSANQENR